MSAISGCTQAFWSSRPPVLLHCRYSLPPLELSPVLCLNTHLGFTRTPSRARSVCTSTLFAGQASVAWSCGGNFGVFIIQRPCSLCCFSKEKGMQSWHSVTDREGFKPPVICSSPGKAGKWDHTALCVCECTFCHSVWAVHAVYFHTPPYTMCFCMGSWAVHARNAMT